MWDGDLMTSLDGFKEKLVAWNKDTFANIFKRKKRTLARLKVVQMSLARNPLNGLIVLEDRLRKE